MYYTSSLISILEVILLILPALLAVAYLTVAERKTMASMQRRLGPNIVGYYGSLQAFADALKLILKEYVAPTQANLILFFLGPIITLAFSLLGYAVIPYGPGISLSDMNLGILYILAVSSLATYGILLAGWSANSKYAFLGSIRSTAQLISYELILSSVILLIIMITNSLNIDINVQYQKLVFFILPLFPVFLIFFIGSVAETNRAPFDLAEAESELVSGFMTEHAAVIFVFFFLAEYASILLMCILSSILFMGGYLLKLDYIINLIFYGGYNISQLDTEWNILYQYNNNIKNIILNSPILYSLTLGLKSSIMVFIFIWVRASFPRIRFDQLMSFCWTVLLPVVFGFIILIPCILYDFDILVMNVNLF
jgi:NADH-ubiquinone oxidoreductase chain 1